MPMRKQYILVSSDDRENAFDSTTSFTVRLSNPILNVVKVDLVEFILDYGVVVPVGSADPSFFFVQSRYLGKDVVTAAGNKGYWRLIPNATNSGVLAYTNSREDEYLSGPRTIQDIDITLLLPDGSPVDNSGKPLRILVEVVSLSF